MGGTSAGDPAKLSTAGDRMRDLANVMYRAAGDQIIGSAGALEHQMITSVGDDGGFADFLVKTARDLVSKLLSGSAQAADGATALWYAAGAFTIADSQLLIHGKHEGSFEPGTTVSTSADGVTTYTMPGDVVLQRDSVGQWVVLSDPVGYGPSAEPVRTINRPLPKTGEIPNRSRDELQGD